MRVVVLSVLSSVCFLAKSLFPHLFIYFLLGKEGPEGESLLGSGLQETRSKGHYCLGMVWWLGFLGERFFCFFRQRSGF